MTPSASPLVHPSVLADWGAWTAQFEGRVAWPYLDVKGLVTVGLGCLIDPVSAALPLPFIPGTLATRVRGALVHDICARFGLSLTPEARADVVDQSAAHARRERARDEGERQRGDHRTHHRVGAEAARTEAIARRGERASGRGRGGDGFGRHGEPEATPNPLT